MAPGRPCCGRAGDIQACIARHHSPCLLLPTEGSAEPTGEAPIPSCALCCHSPGNLKSLFQSIRQKKHVLDAPLVPASQRALAALRVKLSLI